MNGIVGCYNGVIVAGLCRMLVVLPGVIWPEILLDVLVVLRMLPKRLGLHPYLVIFKQFPHCLSTGMNVLTG